LHLSGDQKPGGMKLKDIVFTPWRFAPFKVPDALRAIIFAGTKGYSAEDRRSLAVANVTGYLGMWSSISFALTFAVFDFAGLKAAVIGNIVSAIGTALTPLTHRFGRSAAAIYLAFVFYTTVFFFVSELGRNAGIQLNYIAAAAIVITILGVERFRLAALLIVIGWAFHLIAWFSFPVGSASSALTPLLMSQIYAQSATTIMIILAVVVFYVLRLKEAAQERSEALLLNMMPGVIAERLMENPESIVADRHENATVIFADIREFTKLASQLGPEKIVALLDEVFSEFDTLSAGLGVEKIKTIGDAYMAVAGAPGPHENHADAIMALAIGMHREIAKLGAVHGAPLQLRIGIESGPVMAGVIGQTKFSYDVWGETVNVAARLQQFCEPGEILIGGGAKEALSDIFELKSYGTAELRGVGDRNAWLYAG